MIVHLLVILTLNHISHSEAGCSNIGTLVFCLHSIPTARELKSAGQPLSVIIQSFKGNLTFDGHIDSEQRSVVSVQIQRSNIEWIQPSYFSRLSGQKLQMLNLATVNGTLNLDYATLTGLEDSLKSLRVNDYRIGTTDYLYSMNSLDSLYLVRTELTRLPENFPVLLSHLVNIDFSSNRLSAMPWSMLIERASAPQFREITLSGNEWICDCEMKPVVEASPQVKRKITGLECSYPGELAKLTVTSLTLKDICPNGKSHQQLKTEEKIHSYSSDPGNSGEGEVSSEPLEDGESNTRDLFDQASDPHLATAGFVSTEVIAIIVAVVLVVLIVLIAVIVFMVRSKDNRRRQQGSPKKPSHKSSAYCHVIEHPSSKQGAPMKNSGGARVDDTSGGALSNTIPAPKYGRDFEHNERQPLAPSYYTQQDNRL